jgi:hypothetical protein
MTGIVWICQECVDGSWGVHRCTSPDDCECKSNECLEPVWVGSPRYRVSAHRDVEVAHRLMCVCDGPAHVWDPTWCGPVPVMKRAR